MRVIDYHMHTHFSGDSEANPREHVLKAIEMNLDEICFTDHRDFDYPIDSFDLDIETYYQTIMALKKEFKDKIINIHPSLIPSFCGDKMYGIHIHNAVKACGVRFTGCTVHFVNEKVDGGAIILQEVVPVYFDDTAEDIQKRVLVEEHKLLPKAIDLISKD